MEQERIVADEYTKMFDAGMKKSLRNYAINWKRNYYRRLGKEILLADLYTEECSGLFAIDVNVLGHIEAHGFRFEFHDQSLYDALMALQQKDREIILLHYWEGYSVNELSAMIDMPIKTIYNRRNKALEALRLHIEGILSAQ